MYGKDFYYTGFKDALKGVVQVYYLQLRLNHTESMQDCYERLLSIFRLEVNDTIDDGVNMDKLFEGVNYFERRL